MRRRLLISGALIVSTLGWASPAGAQIIPPGCTFDPGTGLVTFLAAPDITLVREGDALLLNGAGCDGASVVNTDLIQLFADGPANANSITIDLFGGPFAPGATDEEDGSSEIEIELYGTWTFTLLGTAQADHVATGYADDPPGGCAGSTIQRPAINVDATENSPDADIFDCDSYFHAGLSSLVGGEGDDVISLAGGEGFVVDDLSYRLTALGGPGDDLIRFGLVDDAILRGGPGVDVADASPVPLLFDPPSFGMLFNIGSGTVNPPHNIHGFGVHVEVFGFEKYIGTGYDDRFWGSSRAEVFRGGPGNDESLGRAGDDELRGGVGDDEVSGGWGHDLLGGGDGADVVRGAGGSDTVLGWTGADQLFGDAGNDLLRGGLGTDSCQGGPGLDRFGSCETKDTPSPG